MAAGHHHIHPVNDHLLGRCGNGHESGRALAVNGLAGNRGRQPGRQQCIARQVHAGRARGQDAANDDIVDLGSVHASARDCMRDGMGRHGR